MKNNWSEAECRNLARDYLVMLRAERAGHEFSKSEHWRGLMPVLNSRSKAAIERKYQNVSAILEEIRIKSIAGYKPLGNYQLLLKRVVYEELKRDEEFKGAVPKTG